MEKFYLSKALLAGGGVHPPHLPPLDPLLTRTLVVSDIGTFPDLGSFEDTTQVFLL